MRGLFLFLLVGCGDKEDTGEVDTTGDDSGTTEAVDADGDGVAAEEDCDDSDASVSPEAAEECDGVDNNCDGQIDEGFDADGDGVTSCAGDCDDEDSAVSPDVAEECNGVDDNCDGTIDEGLTTTLYEDADGDGYGDPDSADAYCEAVSGLVDNGDDCDDSSATTHPGAAEADSQKDCMADADEDGYGDEAPGDGVTAGTDCDDTAASAFPGGEEVCDGIDNNCDGSVETHTGVSTDFDDKLKDWTLNGDASQEFAGKDGFLLLTDASASQISTAFLTTPIVADAFVAEFTIEIGGGSGADGMVFLFLEESDPTVITDCTGGSCLGAYGLSGYGVEFDTYSSSQYGDPNGNHLSIVDTVDLSIYSSDTTIAELSNGGEYDVEVHYDSGDIDVYFDGSLSMSTTLSDYALKEILFGFSAATGGLTDAHMVRSFSLDACAE